MDLEQKYTEDNIFEMEDLFLQNLRTFGLSNAIKIAKFLDNIHYLDLPQLSDDIQKYGGMVNGLGNTPIYFEVEFLKDLPGIVVLINIESISVDNYLDYINLNLYLQNS